MPYKEQAYGSSLYRPKEDPYVSWMRWKIGPTVSGTITADTIDLASAGLSTGLWRYYSTSTKSWIKQGGLFSSNPATDSSGFYPGTREVFFFVEYSGYDGPPYEYSSAVTQADNFLGLYVVRDDAQYWITKRSSLDNTTYTTIP